MLLHKWENVLILLFILPLLFILFIVIFPYLWSFAFYFVKFLEIKNIYKILIIFSILTLILFSTYYAYYFTEIGWFFGPCFAAGLVALPFYLWELYKIEKEEKDNALIQRMPTLQDYFNKNKKRFITHKKMFFIGLFSVFISIWQIEVPQTIIVNLLPVKLEIINDDFEYIENPGIDNNLYFKEEKTKKFLNFTYSKINIYACDDFKCKEKNRYACDGFGCKGNKKYVGSYWEPWSERSTLMCYMNTAGRCLGTVSKDYDAIEEILKYIKRGKNE